MVNKEALDTLQNYGIHPSVQRIAIMDYLLKNHTHLLQVKLVQT